MSRLPIKIIISCLAVACLAFVVIMIIGSAGAQDQSRAVPAAPAAAAPLAVALDTAALAAAQAAAAPAADAAGAPAEGDAAAPQQPQQISMTVEELLALLQAEADKNNPQAMVTLGKYWENALNGINFQNVNYGKALEWYQKAADLDSSEGLFRLGLCYEIGMGTAPDFPRAMLNYQKASEKGFPPADFKLAVLYMTGNSVPADVDLGLKYLNAAADAGLTLAQKELGGLYYYGRPNLVAKDLTKAMEAFTKAAEAGDAESMKNIGAMTLVGEGIAANKVEALKWYLLAQMFGFNNDEMRTTIDNIKAEMGAEDVALAEAASQAWVDNFRAEQQARVEAAQAEAQAAAAAAGGAAPQSN